ncbi:unnamed protein product [Echinostoma caproni]|uniref:PPM-type phosphatase domain-containing protein n=1 Tax=Echinostoma caproni TaxID=27848 RepID=A0A183APM3_9TREM|nr:unnamed protein product [Echinostoma caproni]
MKLFPLLPKRVFTERIRRARSFTGLNQRLRDTVGQQQQQQQQQQPFSADGMRRMGLPERLFRLQRSSSERVRHSRPGSWLNLWDKADSAGGTNNLDVINRQFFPSRTPSINQPPCSVGNTVFTGNEAIRDVFKLLGGRAKSLPSDYPEVFRWISRWALTSDSLLYYTLGHVTVDTRSVGSQTRVGPTTCDSWGVTNVAGYGIACQDNRIIRFERKHNIPAQACTDLPSHVDVKNHCEFLIRQLKRFNPLQDQPVCETLPCPGPNQSQPVFVERWQEHGNNVIFLLSTGGWQVNFHNHSKLIVHYPHILLACDARRQSKEPGYASSIELSTENLEMEFDRWLDRHPQLDHILQILLFMLL